jgi:hypothetical protein
MRLSDWRDAAPRKESMSHKVLSVIDTALDLFGADPDPDCWVVWGDDPNVRYTIFIPMPMGMMQINVRVMVPGEGPRAGGKLIRWHKVSTGEFAIEIQGGHRMVNWQLEGNVMRGTDESADQMSAFVRTVFEAIDGPTYIGTVAGVGAAGSAAAAPARRRGKTVLRLPAPKGKEA